MESPGDGPVPQAVVPVAGRVDDGVAGVTRRAPVGRGGRPGRDRVDLPLGTIKPSRIDIDLYFVCSESLGQLEHQILIINLEPFYKYCHH